MTWLKPSKENIVKKKQLYGFDIETYGQDNKFLMGSIVNDKDKFVFWDQERMQNFMLKNRNIKNSSLFATNLGFDFTALFNDLKFLKQFKFITRGSNFITIQHKNKDSPKFYDTMNYLRVGVESLGNILNIPKLDKPTFLGEYINKVTDPDESKILEEYNIRDSYISYKFVDFLQNGFNSIGGNLKMTVASCSMNIYRRKYLKYWIKQPKKEILEDCFKAYYGGRVETFRRGSVHDLKLYDFNSLYPDMMKNNKYPYPNSITDKKDLDLEGISLCNIIAPKNLNIPLLPYRTEENKLIFPLGKFTGWYSHVELRKALDLGYYVDIKRSISFEDTFNPFKDFVTDLYKKRMENKGTPLELVFKIVLNSLYGKFAQKLNYSEIVTIETEQDKRLINSIMDYNYRRAIENKPLRFKIDSPCMLEKRSKHDGKLYANSNIYYVTDLEYIKYPKFINPIIALYTTSLARLKLYDLIIRCGDSVYYVDTDSIITDKDLPTGTGLGELKKEIDIKKGIIIKPKFYYLEDHKGNELVKAKGLHNLKKYLDLEKVLKTQKYNYTKFTKFRESLRRDLKFNEKINILKIIDLEDNKRSWGHKKFNMHKLQDSKPLKVSY